MIKNIILGLLSVLCLFLTLFAFIQMQEAEKQREITKMFLEETVRQNELLEEDLRKCKGRLAK